MGTGALSPEVKRLGLKADHSPSSSAVVKMVELYLHSYIRLQVVVIN
jgi:hypothetical protein